MTFIAKNPISSAKLETTPSSPVVGSRGLFPKEDGWYDINDDGTAKKLATEDDIGDIESALDGIIAIQNSLIGGETS